MFTKELLCLAALVGFGVATVPSYIQVCGARDPKLDQCVIKSVEALNQKLRSGMPDLDIPPLDPLYINKVELTNMRNFEAVASDIELKGLADYQVNFLHVDLEKRQIDIDLFFKEIRLTAVYNITARILVPITGKGPISIVTNDVTAKAKMSFKLVERGGKRFMYFPTMTTHIQVKDYTAKFEANGMNSQPLQDAINQALGGSHQEILEAIRPNLEKTISERVLEMGNKLCKRFSYDELFPDRE